jgi:cytochrome P450
MTKGLATEIPNYPMTRDRPFMPAEQLLSMQREAPMTRVRLWDGSSPWLVTRYEEVRQLLRDPRLSSDGAKPGYPELSEGAQSRRQQIKTMMNMDDPEHAWRRRAVLADFTVKKSEQLRPRIQQVTDELLDQMLAGSNPADFVSTVALPLPSVIISEMLGVPYSDHDLFQDYTTTLVSHTSTAQEQMESAHGLLGYLSEFVRRKARGELPGSDLATRLVDTQLRDGSMSEDDIAKSLWALLSAGHETTASMTALSVAVLLDNPQQRGILESSIGDPRALAQAVEELLRFLSIVHRGRRRAALAEIEVGGQVIRPGEGVILGIDAANWDPDTFDEPTRLDLGCARRSHLAFGSGVHQCVGQALARVELQVVLATLFRRVPTLRLAATIERLPFKDAGTVYGLNALPVSW